MAKDINLLPDITLNEERESKRQKLLTVVSMAILVIGTFGLLAAIAIDITLGEVHKRVVAENTKLIETISTYADVEIMQKTLKAKLTTSGTILNAAKDYKTDLENLQSVLPESGIAIQSIGIDKTNKVSISGKASDSSSFNAYVSNLLDREKGSKFFDDITLGSVSTAQDGTLQFSLAMMLKKAEGKNEKPVVVE
jgi:Tfp pilus assembly protein PilN